MSQENVERVRRALAAVAGPGLATNPDTPDRATEPGRLSEFFAPNVVWDLRTFTGWPDRSQVRGLEELSEFVDAWPYADWGCEIFDAGKDRIVAIFHRRRNQLGSDPWMNQPYGVVYTIKGGLIQRGQVYASADEALEAAGLSE